MQIPKAAMNEHERLSLTAFEVMRLAGNDFL
jgi:hypothetical protein